MELLLILCNDKDLLGPRTNTRLQNAAATIAIVTVLSPSTLLTITTVLPHLGLGAAVIITAALWVGAGTGLALTRVSAGRRSQEDTLTPVQRRSRSSPMLELLPAPSLSRSGPARASAPA